ncbi:MAG UNVERIFIED_CONTAM: hypothetical protein LVR18_19955 [Planctomycetaceae bacterium]
MPLLRIELTHETQPDIVRDTIEKARAIIHSVKGDPESMISVFVQSNVQGVFGHSGKPAANVHLSSFNMTPAVTAALTRQLSDLLQSRFGIAPDSAYIFFWNVEQPHLTGWSGRTFAEIMLQQRGIREEFARRVRGRLLNTRSHPKTGQPVPLAGLRIELWNPRPNDTDGGREGRSIPERRGGWSRRIFRGVLSGDTGRSGRPTDCATTPGVRTGSTRHRRGSTGDKAVPCRDATHP